MRSPRPRPHSLFLFLLILATSSCNTEQKRNTEAQAGVANPAAYEQVFGMDVFSNDYGFLHKTEGAVVGAGYNSTTGGFPGPLCLDSNKAENYLNAPPNTSADLANGFVRNDQREIDTRTLLTRTYDMHVSGNGGLGLFSASVDVSAAGTYSSSENRRLYLAEYVAVSPARFLNLSDIKKLLTPAALDALGADKDGSRFQQQCGDYAVVGYQLGAGGSLLISYDAVSEDEAQHSAASLSGGFAGIGSVSGGASGALHTLNESRNLQTSFVGWGGIGQADLLEGIPNVKGKVEAKVATIPKDATPSAYQGLIVRVLLAPWANLLSDQFRPKPQHTDKAFQKFIDLADRRAELEALARSYDLTKNDRGDIRDIVWGMTASDRSKLDDAIQQTTTAMNDVKVAITNCLAKSSDCGKYDSAMVQRAPSGSVWKLREGGQDLIDYVCTQSKPDVGPHVSAPELDKSKPVTIGLFGTYTINKIPEDWSLIYDPQHMTSCCSVYTFIFYNVGSPPRYLPHGQAFTVDRVDDIILQVEKWDDHKYQTRANCTTYTTDQNNPLRLLFAQQFDINTDPFKRQLDKTAQVLRLY